MAGEPTARFAHLLQPIRDLSKVWKIEIAEELERYIEEVSELLITNPVDGVTQLNFAEAALLIQGSTAIYSRKVELLYQLVYQALDLLSLDKKDAKNKARAVQSGLWHAIPETDELLTIDHLIKEGRNIVLDHSAPEQRQATQRRVPLFLMPRDAEDRRKHEFRISGCTVHHTGAYLLQESDARLIDDGTGLEENPDETLEAPLVPAPPAEVQELDNRLQELLREMPPEAPPPEEEAPGSPEPKEKEDEDAKGTPMKGKTPMTAGRGSIVTASKAQGILAANDPWSFIDEHETVGLDTPLEVGKSNKNTTKASKKLLMNAEGLPDPSTVKAVDSMPDEWDFAAAAPTFTAGHPVESLFYSVAGHLKAVGNRYETQRAGFGASWLEFEDLFTQAAARRRQLKSAVKKGAVPGTPQRDDEEGAGSDVEVPDRGTPTKFSTPMKAATPIGNMTPLQNEPTEEELRRDEQRKEVARLETMIQDAQGKYEATIRNHLQSLQKDGAEGVDSRFPELYANVRRWQDQLEPVLKEFESRPEFDIHEYSTKFLDKMSNIPQPPDAEGGEERIIKFSRLVFGQPRWEVCRRFLTCLILTNQGNTDIIWETDGDRLNQFSIKLLQAEKKMISLDGENAKKGAIGAGSSSGAAAGAGGGGRGKRAKPAPGNEPKELEEAAASGAGKPKKQKHVAQ